MKWLRNLFLMTLLTFILLEVCLAVYSAVCEPKIDLPSYSLDNTQSFWYDLNKDFGTWHLPNHSFRQKKSCFDVTYRSNEHGFRDTSRVLTSSKSRVLMIGDSFIEGLGVKRENRLSNRLEKSFSMAHLNFGMAGNFGPTQYVTLYENFALKFSHEAILVGVLPANDFIDDDYSINQKISSNRYKPYWIGNYPDYELIYFQDSLHKSSFNQKDLNSFKRFLKNFSYSYNYLLFVKTKWNQRLYQDSELSEQINIPGYFEFTTPQLNRLKYALIKLKHLAGNRKVMVFTIPIEKEIFAYQSKGENPLGNQLTIFCDSIGIDYLDLLIPSSRLSKSEIENLFLSCDGHWSSRGNAFAKQVIQENFSFYNQ